MSGDATRLEVQGGEVDAVAIPLSIFADYITRTCPSSDQGLPAQRSPATPLALPVQPTQASIGVVESQPCQPLIPSFTSPEQHTSPPLVITVGSQPAEPLDAPLQLLAPQPKMAAAKSRPPESFTQPPDAPAAELTTLQSSVDPPSQVVREEAFTAWLNAPSKSEADPLSPSMEWSDIRNLALIHHIRDRKVHTIARADRGRGRAWGEVQLALEKLFLFHSLKPLSPEKLEAQFVRLKHSVQSMITTRSDGTCFLEMSGANKGNMSMLVANAVFNLMREEERFLPKPFKEHHRTLCEEESTPRSGWQPSSSAQSRVPPTRIPPTPAPRTPAAPTPAPRTPAAPTPAAPTPAAPTPAAPTPAPRTPAAPTPAAPTPAAPTPAAPTPAAPTPAAPTPAALTPAPPTPAAPTPAAPTPAAPTPAPPTPAEPSLTPRVPARVAPASTPFTPSSSASGSLPKPAAGPLSASGRGKKRNRDELSSPPESTKPRQPSPMVAPASIPVVSAPPVSTASAEGSQPAHSRPQVLLEDVMSMVRWLQDCVSESHTLIADLQGKVSQQSERISELELSNATLCADVAHLQSRLVSHGQR